VSVAVHASLAFLLVGVVRLASSEPLPPKLGPNGERVYERSLPQLVELDLDGSTPSSSVELDRRSTMEPGGIAVARPDALVHGRGGDDRGERAQNLADRAEGATRSPSVWSALERAQVQRLATGALRQSYEDWRASRAPGFDDHVALGEGQHHGERRREAPHAPGAGSRRGGDARPRGGELGGWAPDEDGFQPSHPGAVRAGWIREQHASLVPAGIARSVGETSALAAPQGRAQPLVQSGLVSITASQRGRPSDTVESPQAITTRTQSLLDTSTAGGRGGEGRGGEPPGPGAGAGAERGKGSRSGLAGPGGLGDGQIEQLAYVRAMQAKIHPLWADAFPSWAIAEGRSGLAIVRASVDSHGRLLGAVIERRSGVDEFDGKVLAAVKRAAPFGPLPRALGPVLVVQIPFVAKNPAVRPIVP
jgi:TonB family protein